MLAVLRTPLMFSGFLVAESLVKHSDSHSHDSQRGSRLNLSAERCREDNSLFNSSTPLRTEAEIKLMKSIGASTSFFLILGVTLLKTLKTNQTVCESVPID